MAYFKHNGSSRLLLFFLLACEVKLSYLLPDLKVHAELQPCGSKHKNIKNLDNCQKKIDVLIKSTIDAEVLLHLFNVGTCSVQQIRYGLAIRIFINLSSLC